MPKWIHDRAAHLRAKNPDMSESMSWAIATQQAHKTGKSPRGYGTAKGRRDARAKMTGPKKAYRRTADPKGLGAKQVRQEKKAKTAMSQNPTYDMIRLGGFREELEKIAKSGAIGRAAKSFGESVLGGRRKDPGVLARLAGWSKGTKVHGERMGALKNLKSKDKTLRNEALKTLAARGAVGTAGVAGTAKLTKEHRKKERSQLGRAYMLGARDMYSRVSRPRDRG